MTVANKSSVQVGTVSIYLPTHNRSCMLARAIRSVLRQTYADIELIVVDDASEDDTAEVVSKIIAENITSKRIRYFRLPEKQGACAARNLAIREARGHYISGLDDDDYFREDRIEGLLNAFRPEVSGFVFDSYIQESVGDYGVVSRSRFPLRIVADLPHLLRRNIAGNQVLTLTGRMREIGGFDEALPAWQDYDVWIRLARKFGPGKPNRRYSYVRTVHGGPAISICEDRIRRARALFPEMHPEYQDPALLACLNLSAAMYGLPTLSLRDLWGIGRAGEPRLLVSAGFYFLRNKVSARSIASKRI